MLCHVLAFHACYFASVIHVKLKNKKIMATINLSNDFMAKMLEDNAWKELSGELQWTEQMLEKYKEKVDWKEVTTNRNIVWTVPMIEKFKNRIDWDELSSSDNDHLFTAELLDSCGTGTSCRATRRCSLPKSCSNGLRTVGTGAR